MLDEARSSDDLLRLMFIACHPVLSTEARVALTLRLLGGLTTEEIARGFLAAEPTIAQRIVRAKQTLASRQVPFEVPRGDERPARLASVLEVLYLVFNEGYSAIAGDDWMRPGLCDEALRLGRVLAELMPDEPEVHGLVALMEIQASRSRRAARPGGAARPAARAEPRPLGSAADPARFHRPAPGRAAGRPARPLRAAGGDRGLSRAGPHRAETDWARIAVLYQALAALAPSPVVELNRAVAVAMARTARARPGNRRRPRRRARAGRTTTSCPACAATYWPGSAATRGGRRVPPCRRAHQESAERSVLLQRAAECDARKA